MKSLDGRRGRFTIVVKRRGRIRRKKTKNETHTEFHYIHVSIGAEFYFVLRPIRDARARFGRRRRRRRRLRRKKMTLPSDDKNEWCVQRWPPRRSVKRISHFEILKTLQSLYHLYDLFSSALTAIFVI